jgi:hypothetical protein
MKPRTHIRLAAVLIASAVLVAGSLTVLPTSPAVAAEPTGFDAGLIITDEVFYNSSAMNEGAIQAFLESKRPTCAAGYTCLRSYRVNTTDKADDVYCNGYVGQPSEAASRIIMRVAQSCGINPQVLLVLLEKEQGLVTSSAPTDSKYRIATGYGCPDTAPCDVEFYGFFNQVWSAARAYQRYTVNTTSQQYQPGRTNYVLYHPDRTCGGTQLYIHNQATANLYIYTPYQPNHAALSNLYGSGDACSSYGNRNFWRIFTDWFGNPGNLIRSGGFEGGSTAGWNVSGPGINNVSYNAESRGIAAKYGNFYGATNTARVGGSIFQDVSRSVGVGQKYVAEVWVRSADPSVNYSGTVALWALGGSGIEVASSSFHVLGEWTLVRVELLTLRSHGMLRLEIYEDTLHADLLIDGASLLAETEALFGEANLARSPSFEGGSVSNWQMSAAGAALTSVDGTGTSLTAREGRSYAAAPGTGGSVFQDIPRTINAGQPYTASIWVRSSNPSVPYSGELALWGLGGAGAEVGSTTFSVGSEWTLVTASLNPASTHTLLRIEVYENTTTADLHLDAIQVTGNLARSPSFEGGSVSNWQMSAAGAALTSVDGTGTSLTAREGRSYAAAPGTGGSVFQDIPRTINAGQPYTASIWVRSSNPSVPYSGELALWGLGGAGAEVGSTTFSVGSEWTLVTASLNPASTHTLLRIEVYENTTTADLHLDAIQVR